MDISEDLKHDIQEGEVRMEAFLFYISVWWRVVYGLANLVFGILLLWFVGWMLSDVFAYVTQAEIAEDTTDFWVTLTGSWIGDSQVKISFFTAGYFIFWGVLDMFLYTSILLKKMWAYSIAIYLISFFVLYMFYRYTQTGSNMLLILIPIDLSIVWLTFRERARVRTEQKSFIHQEEYTIQK